MKENAFKTLQVFKKGQNQAYNHKFLHPKKAEPDQFLKDIAYQINLGNLYKLLGTTFYHSRMPYVAVSLAIKDSQLQEIYHGTHLIQVWKKGGKKVFERVLNDQVKRWACYQNILLYVSPSNTDFSENIIIVDLDDPYKQQIIVKDFTLGKDSPLCAFEFMFYETEKSMLWLGNRNFICVAPIPKGKYFDEVVVKEEQICYYDPCSLIRGFYPLEDSHKSGRFMICFETLDHQLDFNFIYAESFEPETFQPVVNQQRDIVTRDGYENEQVLKVCVFFSWENVCYAFVLLSGDKADLYWNMRRIGTSESRTKIEEIAFSEQHFYYKKSMESKFVRFELSMGSQMNMETAQEVDDFFDESTSNFNNVKSFMSQFTSFTLIRDTCYIAHGNILSQYNIIENMWMCHTMFSDIILQVVRWKDTTKHKFVCCVITNQGEVFNDIYTPKQILNQVEDLSYVDPDVKIPHAIISIFPDQEDSEKTYMLVLKLGFKFGLFMLRGSEYLEVIGTVGLNRHTRIVISFSEADNTQFVLKDKNQVCLYEQMEADPDLGQAPVKQIHRLVTKDAATINQLNSAFSTNFNEKICLVDEKNIYIWNIEEKNLLTIYDQFIKGLYFFDEQYCYTLSLPSKGKNGGLRLYEAHGLLQGQDDSYLLVEASIGCSGQIDYNRANVRIAYQKSAEIVEVVPLLHRNTIAFLGMPPKSEILATRTQDNKFTILCKDKRLKTWDICTGKLIAQKFTNVDITDYSLTKMVKSENTYKSHHYDKVLLRNDYMLEDVDESEFFSKHFATKTAKNQRTFLECTQKQFYWFQLVTIVSENEAKILRKFKFTQYQNFQRVFFSEDANILFEELENKRVIIYEWFPEGNSKFEGKFVMKQKLLKYPDQLLPHTPFLCLNSPDFSKFIDFDESFDCFVLRDLMSQRIISKIPQTAMPRKNEDPSMVIRRFKWIDNRYFKFITKGGVERLIDTEDHFREITYNVVQDIQVENGDIKHFYNMNRSIKEHDVALYLKNIQNQIKSAYYLEGKRGREGLYPIMFSVDMGHQDSGFEEKFKAVHSFTFVDWKLITELGKNSIDLFEIDLQQIERLCWNILPGGNTILHHICPSSDLIYNLFNISQPKAEDRSQFRFHIPYILNFQDKGFLDLCFERKDMKVMNTALEFLKGYGIDHHSRGISHLLLDMIDLPNFVDYVESRMQVTNVTQTILRGEIQPKTQGIVPSTLEVNKDLISKDLFNRRAKIEQEVSVVILDIPKVHDFKEKMSDQFFKIISKKGDFDVFHSIAVQKLINFKYKVIRKQTMNKLFIPFCVFQGSFFIYTSAIKMAHRRDPTHYPLFLANYSLQALLLCLSIYFLQNQAFQIRRNGSKYLKDLWNIIDIVNPTLVLYMIFNFYIDTKPLEISESETIISSISTFTMWAKQLYFLRVFDSFSYLIRMISLVIIDMREFLAVLFVAILAFSDTYRTISEGNSDPEQQFVQGTFDSFLMSYKMALGDFDTDNFGGVALPLCLIFFYLSTVFNMIVMFNLLIAIISETFATVNANANLAAFQERSNMVAENSYLVSQHMKNSICKENSFLVIAQYKGSEVNQKQDPIVTKIDQVQKNVNDSIERLQKNQKKIEATVNAIAEHFQIIVEEEEELSGQLNPGGLKILEKMQRGIKGQYGFNQLGNVGKKSTVQKSQLVAKQKSFKDKSGEQNEEEKKQEGDEQQDLRSSPVQLIANEQDRPHTPKRDFSQPIRAKSGFNKKISTISDEGKKTFEEMKEQSMIDEPDTPKNRVLSTSIAMHSVRNAKRTTLGKFN